MKAKKVLASLLCLIMTVSLFPMSVFAAEGAASPVKYGYYNAEDTWVEGDLEQNLPDGVESVEKTAEQSAADPNVYDITLQVKTYTTTATTSPGAAATVLVIDTSGSMEYCAECGREIDWHYKCQTLLWISSSLLR